MKLPFGINFKIFKEPQTKKTVKKDVELGASGTSIFGGVISESDYIPELTGTDAITTYNKMRKSDGVVKASILACTLPLRAINWYVKPASDDKLDQEIAEFIEYNLFEAMTITWDDFLRQALLMLPFGHISFEKVFTSLEFNGKDYIGWRKFAPRLPDTIYKWQTEDNKDGITQITASKGTVSIPMDKLLIFVYDKEGDNWEGTSILRSAYRSWYFKEYIEKINAMAFERQGLGIPIIKLPEGHTTQDITKAKEILKNIRANEQAYIILPPGWEFEFVDPKANSVKDPKETIQRYNREILISVLAQFLDLGSGPYGSRALSADQSTTFHNNLTAIAKQIKDVINKYAIQQLVDLNFDVQYYPSLEHGKIGMVEYDKLAKALQSLVQTGVLKTDDELEAYIREVMGLPEKMEDTEEKEKSKPEPKEEVKKKSSEMRFFEPWRKLTFAERKVNFKDINAKMDIAEAELKKSIKEVLKKGQTNILKQVENLLSETDITKRRQKITKLAMKYQGEYRQLILNHTKELFEYSKTLASHEMKKPVPSTPQKAISNMSLQADSLTDKMNDDIVNTAKVNTLTNLQQGKTKPQTLALVSTAVKKKVDSFWQNTPPVVVSGSINQGRRTAFDKYKDSIYALQRSEVLDTRTCNYCLSLDGRVFKKSDPFTKVDGFHTNCRGIWVEVMKEEPEKPKITGIPKSLRTAFGGQLNLVKQPTKPIIKKDSFVVKNHPELL